MALLPTLMVSVAALTAVCELKVGAALGLASPEISSEKLWSRKSPTDTPPLEVTFVEASALLMTPSPLLSVW